MPTLTRRRYPERDDCWHVYYGDVKVGTIAVRAGVPVDVDQWGFKNPDLTPWGLEVKVGFKVAPIHALWASSIMTMELIFGKLE